MGAANLRPPYKTMADALDNLLFHLTIKDVAVKAVEVINNTEDRETARVLHTALMRDLLTSRFAQLKPDKTVGQVMEGWNAVFEKLWTQKVQGGQA